MAIRLKKIISNNPGLRMTTVILPTNIWRTSNILCWFKKGDYQSSVSEGIPFLPNIRWKLHRKIMHYCLNFIALFLSVFNRFSCITSDFKVAVLSFLFYSKRISVFYHFNWHLRNWMYQKILVRFIEDSLVIGKKDLKSKNKCTQIYEMLIFW